MGLGQHNIECMRNSLLVLDDIPCGHPFASHVSMCARVCGFVRGFYYTKNSNTRSLRTRHDVFSPSIYVYTFAGRAPLTRFVVDVLALCVCLAAAECVTIKLQTQYQLSTSQRQANNISLVLKCYSVRSVGSRTEFAGSRCLVVSSWFLVSCTRLLPICRRRPQYFITISCF